MTAGGRRIALLGSINRDTIRTPDGVETESYGGLLYTLLPLAQIAASDTTIQPVYDVGQDVEAAVRAILEPYPNVSLDALTFVGRPNPHCVIEYAPDGSKQETLRERGLPLPPARLAEACAGADALILNFITGFELELDTLRAFRAERPGPIVFMDFHSLSLGIDSENRRFWRRPDDWAEWMACTDFVQVNVDEASLLAGTDLDEAAESRFAADVLDLGPRCVTVTRSNSGSTSWFRKQGRLEACSVDASKTCAVDPTGCGDAYMAGFVCRCLETQDIQQAARFANRVAGIACSVRGIEGLGDLGRRLQAAD